MEKQFCVIWGVKLSKNWKLAEGCSTTSKLNKFRSRGKSTIVTIEDDKAKIYKKDRKGIWRCLVWPLITSAPEVETEQILLASFFATRKRKPKIQWQKMPVAA